MDHLVSTTHYLLSKYPNAGVVIGGDKNNLNIAALLSGIPRLRQVVTKNTYKDKILEIILTKHMLYLLLFPQSQLRTPVVVHPVITAHQWPTLCLPVIYHNLKNILLKFHYHCQTLALESLSIG